jgi:hypothetical protein
MLPLAAKHNLWNSKYLPTQKKWVVRRSDDAVGKKTRLFFAGVKRASLAAILQTPWWFSYDGRRVWWKIGWPARWGRFYKTQLRPKVFGRIVIFNKICLTVMLELNGTKKQWTQYLHIHLHLILWSFTRKFQSKRLRQIDPRSPAHDAELTAIRHLMSTGSPSNQSLSTLQLSEGLLL